MTALSIPHVPTAETVGLHRRLARICDAAGLIRTIAIDHPDTYLLLFDDDVSSVTFEEVVESKLEMIAELSRHATSVLADPVWSFGQAVVTGALPGDVGLISGLEDLYYTPATSSVGFDTELRLKQGWDPARLSALGADAAKLVVFHREDADPAVVAHQHEVVAQAAQDCHAVGLPLIVEPLWFPVDGESLDDPAVRDRRRSSVLASARSFHDVGADIMKVEFPLLDLTDRDACHAACAELDAAVDGPWVLLSAGVTFEGFRTQVDVAADHGCSGFMAGRAIWGDAVGRLDAGQRAAGAALAARRLDELAEVLEGRGAPAWTPVPMADAVSVVGETWYRTSGTPGA
ncbi:tagatose 1,6-diphosphate aldolase [Fodinibacter luteus]|uniref:Tagatose 1,6-diphosphate aldolase n=1 Tax=Fodinibacter luteus TaxID=552064 RepID=A0ABP8JZA2_9MICO